MTLLWTEGFDSTSSDCTMIGVTRSTPQSDWGIGADRYPGDTLGGVAVLSAFSEGEVHWFRRDVAVAERHATFIAGFAIALTSTFSGPGVSGGRMFSFGDSAGATQATLWRTSGGALELRQGSGSAGTLICGSAGGVIQTNSVWYYVEVKLTVGTGDAVARIRVNEVTVAQTTTGITPSNLDHGAVTFWIPADSTASGIVASWNVDDFYLCNGAGSDSNDFLGDVRILSLRPSAAGTHTEWTPVGATNFENVNNNATLDAAIHNATGIDEETDYYTVPDLPASATGDILAVVVKGTLWTSVLTASAALLVQDSSAEAEGPEITLGTTTPGGVTAQSTPTGYAAVFETKPSGGAWTADEVNALQPGIRLKSVS